jgi:ATP-dependent Lhr-like helicase
MSSQASALALEYAYGRLHPFIRSWIRDQGWTELREVQARAILAILDSTNDVVIAAATAAGKTEAAFLPVLTAITERTKPGFSTIYVSPLKALINDQFRRLDELGKRMGMPVVKWHGDASHAEKKRAYTRPGGVVLITPESIEAMFVRRPADARRLLGAADFILIDELHAFLQGPRGLHVASLLRRIDAVSSAPARRIGLSATIGDLKQAAAWLRPSDPANVEILKAKSDAPELRLQVRGYREPPDLDDQDRAEVEEPAPRHANRVALDNISDHLFETLRGANNLVFGGSRRTVEATADRLRRRSERANVPNEFFPHHGSLSKSLREELEERLKAANLPTTAICTSTLELGVDIGSVQSVAQVGAPRSLSSLRQRLGRTGRRGGTPSILRIYIREPHIGQKSSLIDQLRIPTIRAVAAVGLLLKAFVEPPAASPETASTLVHQILSIITERGGIRPASLYGLLCGPGPFARFSQGAFATMLRHMGSPEVKLIEQAPDGTLMLGAAGEAIVQSRDFFAVFEAPQEWRLISGGRTLGALPISFPVYISSLVVFAGRRWIVEGLDPGTKTLQVAPHTGGVVPRFERTDVEPAHDRLVEEMRAVYQATDVPPYLDGQAQELLAEGRAKFEQLRLSQRSLVEHERDLHVFLWRGSQAIAVFGAALAMTGLTSEVHDLGVTIPKTTIDESVALLRQLSELSALSAPDVAAFVRNIRVGKFAEFVPADVACTQWAEQNADLVKQVPAMAEVALQQSRL